MIFSGMVWRLSIELFIPVMALFVVSRIEGGGPVVVGISAMIALLTKSLFQIPAAAIADKIDGEFDDFWMMFLSALLSSLFPLLLLYVETPTGLYAVQFATSASLAFSYPTFMAIMTRHIPPKKVGTIWGTYFTLTDVAGAIGAALGGLIAVTYGFDTLIMLVSGIGVASAFLYIPIYHFMKHAKKRAPGRG